MIRYLAVSAALALTWSLTATQANPPAADAGQVRELVKRLDSPRFAEREKADRALRDLGVTAVPLLREELKTAGGLESRRRVERIIAELTTLPWHRDVAKAVEQARAEKKPILVFSTMGEPSGFA
jgi:hypothetical protein